jgi:excisionase family DNA binding protein
MSYCVKDVRDIMSKIDLGDDMEIQTISVLEAARKLGIGKTLAYDSVKRGEIPVIRMGSRFRVPVRALEKLLEEGGRVPADG